MATLIEPSVGCSQPSADQIQRPVAGRSSRQFHFDPMIAGDALILAPSERVEILFDLASRTTFGNIFAASSDGVGEWHRRDSWREARALAAERRSARR